MSRYRALGLFLALGALWGGSFPAIKAGLDYFPPVLFAAARYDVAAVILVTYAVLATDHWWPTTRDDWGGVAAAGLFLVAGNGLLFIGQQYVTSGVGAIIYSLVPILTTGFAFLLLSEGIDSALGFVGIGLGLVGVGIVARPDPNALLSSNMVGIGFVLAAAVSVALGSVLLRRTDPDIGDAALTGWAMVLGGLLLHGGSLAAGESVAAVDLAPAALVVLAYVGLLATGVAYLIYFNLLGAYGPLEANLVSYVVPVVAAVVGWALLGETLTPLTLGGFLVIFAGFALLKRDAIRGELVRLQALSG